MNKRLGFCLSLVVLLAIPVLAHHPFSTDFDWKQPVTVSGTVMKVEWENPHAHLYIDAKGPDGNSVTWAFEMGNLGRLKDAGWKKDTLKLGDTVFVDAWLSKTKGNMGNVKSVRLYDGRELSGASSIADPNADEAKPRLSKLD
jgi:hypothetical protein